MASSWKNFRLILVIVVKARKERVLTPQEAIPPISRLFSSLLGILNRAGKAVKRLMSRFPS